MTEPAQFTWVPLYTELARLLLDWEDRQAELIDACHETSPQTALQELL